MSELSSSLMNSLINFFSSRFGSSGQLPQIIQPRSTILNRRGHVQQAGVEFRIACCPFASGLTIIFAFGPFLTHALLGQ